MSRVENANDLDRLAGGLDFGSTAFIADPYPALADLRDAAPLFWHEATGRWIATRHTVVQSLLRDRRLGRAYAHREAVRARRRTPVPSRRG